MDAPSSSAGMQTYNTVPSRTKAMTPGIITRVLKAKKKKVVKRK